MFLPVRAMSPVLLIRHWQSQRKNTTPETPENSVILIHGYYPKKKSRDPGGPTGFDGWLKEAFPGPRRLLLEMMNILPWQKLRGVTFLKSNFHGKPDTGFRRHNVGNLNELKSLN